MGPLGHGRVFDYLAISDVFVSASKTETSSMSVLEAMSMKTASVTSNVSGFSEIVKNGRTGLLISEDSPAAFAEGILFLIDDRKKLDQFKENAFLESLNYTPEKPVQQTIDLYSELIHSKSRTLEPYQHKQEIEIKKSSGRVFIFFHCYTGSTGDFYNLPEYLSQRFNASVRVISLLGHGGKITDLDGYNYDDYYRQAERVLREELLIHTELVLVGLSLGAQIALELSSNYKVKGVVLVSMPFYFIFPFNLQWTRYIVKKAGYFKKSFKKRLARKEKERRRDSFYYSHMPVRGFELIWTAKQDLRIAWSVFRLRFFLYTLAKMLLVTSKALIL